MVAPKQQGSKMSDFTKGDYLNFEAPVKELENQIKGLREASSRPELDIGDEIEKLQKKVDALIKDIYGQLTQWEKVQLARHPKRLHTVDYIDALISDFHEIHGDRYFSDDASIITGFGKFGRKKVAVIGIEKGRKTKEKIARNFGMPNPEGYRKAMRVMELAGRFGIPIITFIDTPGAYPGLGAEERGQASAIANNLVDMFAIKSPIVAVVIGEGGSGGALGIAIADKVLMMEYSIYSVISPESCASILWADPKHAETAANGLKLDANKALELEVIDKIIPEPSGGAHRDPDKAVAIVKKYIDQALKEIMEVETSELLENRFRKFRKIGNNTITIVQ